MWYLQPCCWVRASFLRSVKAGRHESDRACSKAHPHFKSHTPFCICVAAVVHCTALTSKELALQCWDKLQVEGKGTSPTCTASHHCKSPGVAALHQIWQAVCPHEDAPSFREGSILQAEREVNSQVTASRWQLCDHAAALIAHADVIELIRAGGGHHIDEVRRNSRRHREVPGE